MRRDAADLPGRRRGPPDRHSAGQGQIEVQGRKILGCSQEPDSFGTFFVVELDRDVQSVGTFENGTVYEGQSARSGRGVGAYVNFKTGDHRGVAIKVGSSFISREQAERNLERESALWGSTKFARGRRPTGRATRANRNRGRRPARAEDVLHMPLSGFEVPASALRDR